jgi:uncharacterized protein involved in exopolysaccharide biosynthesis
MATGRWNSMIARHVIARLLETFFSRWWLYILPVVALTGFGVYTAGSKADSFRSSAVLSAVEPLLADLQDVARTDTQFFESAAEATARRINESLRTEAFVQAVASGAGIPDDSTLVTLLDVRNSVWASADGRSNLTVNARTFDAQLAQRLVQSTIDTFLQSVVDDQISNATATVNYLLDQQEQLQEDLEVATEALSAFLLENPPPPLEADRSIEEELEIGRLNRTVERADTRLADTLDDIRAAELLIEQATSDAAQTLRVVDPPTLAGVPETGLRTVAMTVGTFGVLGVMLMFGSVIVASLLDRSLRFAEEIRASLGIEVLAVVPVEPHGRGRRRRKALT